MNATATAADSKTVPILLTVVEWNQVLAILSEHPFRVVAPLISKIHSQAQTALGAAQNGPLFQPQGEPHGLEN